MEKSNNTFQIIILAVFGLATVVGVMIFAGFIKVGGSESTDVKGSVTIWGTVPRSAMAEYLDSYQISSKNISLTYIPKNADTFSVDLVEALASGKGPDIIFLPQDELFKNIDRINVIPYQSFSQRTIEDNYIRQANLLLTKDGVLGVPISVDPLMLYYNRDLFDNAGIATVPKTWEDIAEITPKLTIIDPDSRRIKQSAVALGGYGNITHNKDLISLFMFQSGAPIVELKDGVYQCTLKNLADQQNSPLENNFKYFMQYSDPSSQLYSWNGGLPSSHDSFVAGKLAMYIGRASELFSLQQQNPNFSYDIAQIPQWKNSQSSVTYGTMLSAVIMKSTKNFPASFQVILSLAGTEFETKLSENLSLPPVRRDLLSMRPASAYVQSFYNAALISRGWFDPEPTRTEAAVRDFMGNISSGRLSFSQSVADVCAKIDSIIAEKTLQ